MSTTVLITIPMLVCFFALMIGVGVACRKHATNVDGFVLGGRAVGPTFLRLSLSATRGSLAGTSAWRLPG